MATQPPPLPGSKKSDVKVSDAMKVFVGLLIICLLVISLVLVISPSSWRRTFKPERPKVETNADDAKPGKYDANTKAGELAGSAMGHMVGVLGKSYPSEAEIESIAKTSAVDFGTSVNDFFFVSAFKRSFAKGYAEGRNSR